MQVNYSRPALPGPINFRDLAELRQQHMPAVAVQFSPLSEVQRVGAEVVRQKPHLVEEVAFVVAEEEYRREQLANSPLEAVKGGQNRG